MKRQIKIKVSELDNVLMQIDELLFSAKSEVSVNGVWFSNDDGMDFVPKSQLSKLSSLLNGLYLECESYNV